MDENITKALNGELDEKGLQDLEASLSDEGKRLLKEALAFKAKKKDDEEKARKAEAEAKAEAEKLEAIRKEIASESEKLESTKKETSQFRQEQILKAKTKFFAEYKIPAEEQEKYTQTFEKFDSNKVDPDLIFDDFVSVYAALNKDSLLKAQKEAEELKKNADLHNAGEAGSHSTPPAGQEPPKFSEAAMELSKKAGISPEAADKQLKQGMSRILA